MNLKWTTTFKIATSPSILGSGRPLVFTLFFIFLSSPSVFAQDVPDIRTLPRLSAKLPKGTLAWATIDQIHPLQPQTGKREVSDKEEKFEGLMRSNFEKFSADLYEYLFLKSIIPVYIGKTPSSDSRYKKQAILGYDSDRTHTANAMADLIEYFYGKRALSEPIYDAKGRPINAVIVRVERNLSGYTPERLASTLVKAKVCYLKRLKRARDGSTVIEKIDFTQLPEKVYDTTDNPFRSMISTLLHDDVIPKRKRDFYQLTLAEQLARAQVVDWNDIRLNASDKSYEDATESCAAFYEAK